jgi:uncharacterized repeat protein (TIGR01451 family)
MERFCKVSQMHISDLLHPRYARVALLLAIEVMVPARAQDSPTSTSDGLVVETIAERRVVTSSGEGAQVKFVAADQLHIGDEIFYTVRVRNRSNAPIEDVVVVKAIPRNTEYVADSAVGPAAIVGISIDGGTTFSTPEELEIATLPGVTRPANASDYTHIRWQLQHPLAAGATALLRFRGVFK